MERIASTTAPGVGARWRTAGKAAVVLEMAGLVALSVVSHLEPLPLGLKALALGPPSALALACFTCAFVVGHRRPNSSKLPWKLIVRHAICTSTFIVLALGVAGGVSASIGNDVGCPQGEAGSCYKSGSWAIRDGRYYRLYPYDVHGNSISGAPWVQITEKEYIAGAGADLRDADGAGIGVASFAYLIIVAMEASAARSYAATAGGRVLQFREVLPKDPAR